MKRIVSLLLALILALTLVACNGGRGKGSSTGSDLTQAQIDKLSDKALKEMEKQQNK